MPRSRTVFATRTTFHIFHASQKHFPLWIIAEEPSSTKKTFVVEEHKEMLFFKTNYFLHKEIEKKFLRGKGLSFYIQDLVDAFRRKTGFTFSGIQKKWETNIFRMKARSTGFVPTICLNHLPPSEPPKSPKQKKSNFCCELGICPRVDRGSANKSPP